VVSPILAVLLRLDDNVNIDVDGQYGLVKPEQLYPIQHQMDGTALHEILDYQVAYGSRFKVCCLVHVESNSVASRRLSMIAQR
jgi:hypothetical protein